MNRRILKQSRLFPYFGQLIDHFLGTTHFGGRHRCQRQTLTGIYWDYPNYPHYGHEARRVESSQLYTTFIVWDLSHISGIITNFYLSPGNGFIILAIIFSS